MDERHLETVQAVARLAVDELHTLAVEPGKLGAKVIDLVRDVVHAGAAPAKETAHRRVFAEWREQLDPGVADVQRHSLGALRLDRLASFNIGAEQPSVCGDGLVQIGDRNADVVNGQGRHAPMLVDRPRCSLRVGPVG